MAKRKNRKKWNRKKTGALAGLGVLLIVLVFIFFRGNREKIRQIVEASFPKDASATQETLGSRTVTLFFLSDEDGMLHPEEREIEVAASPVLEAQQVIRELIKGPAGGLIATIPRDTRLRQVFITKQGVAYVDFSKDIVEKYSYGSSGEMATVYSIVNSLASNFKSIKKVAILIEGSEKETLGGHIDLSQPFSPLNSLTAK
ncbi:MAG: GerMN domain-containing protein [Acidobacteriota bacterium]|nr:GerMN domain-containing protein [Acidobacteriota bacterium]